MKDMFQQFDRIADFPHAKRGRILIDGNGKTTVAVYDPHETQPEYKTDIFTVWNAIPGLKDCAINAYLKEATKRRVTSHMTRKVIAEIFGRLAKYLTANGLDDQTPETLSFYDCEDLITYVASLGLVLPHHEISPLRLIVEEIWNDPKFDGKRDPHLFVRQAPFPGSGLRGGKREILNDALWGDMIAKASAQVRVIMTDRQNFNKALVRRADFTEWTPTLLQTKMDCAVWAYQTFGPRLPSFLEIKWNMLPYWRQIQKIAGGWKEVLALIHPTLPSLMPFIALFGCYTLFNKSVLTEFSLDDVDYTELAGTKRVVYTPLKKRAGKKQLRSFALDDALDHPDVMFRFLVEYTEDLRGMVEDVFRRRLFLFWTLNAKKIDEAGPSAFTGATTGTGAEDSRFTYYWQLWCKEQGFEGTAFSSLRITGLNLAHRAFGGDVRAIAALASHSSHEVFDHHYKSAHSRARNDRKLGKAMLMRERMLRSEGAIDPVRRLRGESLEAATPGFGCLDPFHSPVAGQKEGRACAAYGQCPGCPLATTNTEVAANLVRMKQLEAEYVDAIQYLAPHYWRDKYSLHMVALRTEWLPMFVDERVLQEAARMQVKPLPPLT